jgi:hypothetical protein
MVAHRGACLVKAKLIIEPPSAFINANVRLHHHAKAKLTAKWRREANRQTWVQVGGVQFNHAHVTVGIRFPTNHRRDVGNYYPTAKAILDGLVDAGLLEDDDDTRVTGPDMRRIRPNGSPLVVVTITETES